MSSFTGLTARFEKTQFVFLLGNTITVHLKNLFKIPRPAVFSEQPEANESLVSLVSFLKNASTPQQKNWDPSANVGNHVLILVM